MPNSDDLKISPEQLQLCEILTKIETYQRSLSDGRAVELDELRREDVLTPADFEFLTSHSVTYKPHRRSDYHAGDMLNMPTPDGGCFFIGPNGPPLKKRRAPLGDFQAILENFLKLPIPWEELLLHIEFTEHDGIAVAPEMICCVLTSATWRQRLPALRSVAAEFGFHPVQDGEMHGIWSLIFRVAPDASRTAAAVAGLLRRGCGLPDETKITYSAGALDTGSPNGAVPEQHP